MKLAVSNIAWPAERRDDAYALLRDAGISGLEVAPGLLFPEAAQPFAPTAADVSGAMAPIARAGLHLVSMQSLLFGVTGAALFGTPDQQQRFEEAMARAITLAGTLAIPNLVFGSPRQRAFGPELSAADAWAMATQTFRRLGDLAARAGTRIAIEPNAKAYGTNFLNRVEEAEAFVRHVAHPAIVLNFDIGALHGEEDFPRIEAIATAAADCIGHVHISEPGLAPAPASSTDAARALLALIDAGYDRWYSIEMAAQPEPIDVLRACLERLNTAISLLPPGLSAR